MKLWYVEVHGNPFGNFIIEAENFEEAYEMAYKRAEHMGIFFTKDDVIVDEAEYDEKFNYIIDKLKEFIKDPHLNFKSFLRKLIFEVETNGAKDTAIINGIPYDTAKLIERELV